MRESVEAARSWLRAHAEERGLGSIQFEEVDIHVHVPSGAVPKDGPSAGVGMVTSLASLLTGSRVRSDLAMTGEISLRGRILPVGGIKAKVFAAARAGIETVVMPRRNEKDLIDIPDDIKEALSIHTVETIEDALALTLPPSAS